MTTFERSLYLFRRDLRVPDNLGLHRALEESQEVIPAFIFDPRQAEEHPYFSPNSLQFLIDSLKSLDNRLRSDRGRLYLFYGEAESVIAKLIEETSINALFLTHDYTPFSKARDAQIRKICDERGVSFNSEESLLVVPPSTIRSAAGKPYTSYRFYSAAVSASSFTLDKLSNLPNLSTRKISDEEGPEIFEKLLPVRNTGIAQHGGREEAEKRLAGIKDLSNYEQSRDIPLLRGSTNLSPHLKFGTCSPREVLMEIRKHFGLGHKLEKEVLWRDFLTALVDSFPHVLSGAFYPKFDNLDWARDEEAFKRWTDGSTGFPIVDAGMRQLRQTGYMPNRVRMIAASFLVKDLHISYRDGERYFARNLIDYDPSVNNGNWQWIASVGAEAQPYFRIFNPWSQQRKSDPEALYIKEWVPELRNIPAEELHRLHEKPLSHTTYPVPMVSHQREAKVAERMFFDVKSSSA